MQALGRFVSSEVVEHFAGLLKQKVDSADAASSESETSLENVVRPAAFHKGSASKAASPQADAVEAEMLAEADEPPPDASRVEARSGSEPRPDVSPDGETAFRTNWPSLGEYSLSELSSALHKIEAAGASMRLVEERANQQSAWTQDFLSSAKNRLKDAETRVQEVQERFEQSEKRAAAAELAAEIAEQRCRAAEHRLELAEARVEAAEHRVQAALDLAHNAEARCTEAVARAVEAERWMRDVLNTLAKEFPAAQVHEG